MLSYFNTWRIFRNDRGHFEISSLKLITNLKWLRSQKMECVHVRQHQSTGFPRGSSKFRGVTLHKYGKWEARMGQLLGKK